MSDTSARERTDVASTCTSVTPGMAARPPAHGGPPERRPARAGTSGSTRRLPSGRPLRSATVLGLLRLPAGRRRRGRNRDSIDAGLRRRLEHHPQRHHRRWRWRQRRGNAGSGGGAGSCTTFTGTGISITGVGGFEGGASAASSTTCGSRSSGIASDGGWRFSS